eukprot:130507-Chlamydomonas_euryale.AAC.1
MAASARPLTPPHTSPHPHATHQIPHHRWALVRQYVRYLAARRRAMMLVWAEAARGLIELSDRQARKVELIQWQHHVNDELLVRGGGCRGCGA